MLLIKYVFIMSDFSEQYFIEHEYSPKGKCANTQKHAKHFISIFFPPKKQIEEIL